LQCVVDNIDRVQDYLGRRILIENPSRYLAYAASNWCEADFLHELCRRTGCGLLLDINNILVSAHNLGRDPEAWLDAFDPRLVGEIHVAGHAVKPDGAGGTIAIDDHGSPVGTACWTLLDRFLRRAGPTPVLVEWDSDVPDYAVLRAEAARADALIAACSPVTADA
jgi:uncharacterized protein (UPF0276 family)